MTRYKRARLVCAGVSAIAAVLLPSTKWAPPPESVRIGPVQYDDMISSPRKIPIGSTSAENSTDVKIFLRFTVRERPADFAYVFSTAAGPGNGLKVAIDLYGNLYFSASMPNTTSGDYQLVKLSDPTPPGMEYSLKIRIDTNRSLLQMSLNDESVLVVEPRPMRKFDVGAVRPLINNVEVGGADGHSLKGTVMDFEMVFGRSDPRVDLVNVKILLMLIALGLAVSTVRYKDFRQV